MNQTRNQRHGKNNNTKEVKRNERPVNQKNNLMIGKQKERMKEEAKGKGK